ncbi:hypothetical protein ACERK3_19625, partial [Phycisphaerales bacterium AB-hyl4]
ALTGSLTLNHLDTGVTVLTGTQDYTGNTNVRQGVLIFDDANAPNLQSLFLGTNAGDNASMIIRNGSNVAVNNNTRVGHIADSDGHLVVTGAGTTLDLPRIDVGRAGFGILEVTDGAVVDATYLVVIGDTIDSVGNVTVSGQGSRLITQHVYLSQFGDGVLSVVDGGVVEASNYLSLATSPIATGTVNIGDGGAAGILDTPEITTGSGDATVNFNHTDSDYYLTRDGTADGDAVLLKGGLKVIHHNTGTTTLLGTHSYTGNTNVTAGTLLVNGTIAHSDFHVFGSGTLGGTGTVGNLLMSDGILSPGNSIGTFTVDGDYTHGSFATLYVEIIDGGHTPGVHNDHVYVTGEATILGGKVDVFAEPGNYHDGTQYTILTADGGVDGKFDTVSSNLFDVALSYTAHDVLLTLTLDDKFTPPGDDDDDDWTGHFEQLARSGGQRGVGRVIDHLLPHATGDLAFVFNELAGLDDANARDAIQQLSGETTGASSTAVVQATTSARNTVFNRSRPAVASLALPGPATSFQGGSLSLASADTQQSARQLADMSGPTGWLGWVQGYGEYGD